MEQLSVASVDVESLPHCNEELLATTGEGKDEPRLLIFKGFDGEVSKEGILGAEDSKSRRRMRCPKVAFLRGRGE